MGRRDASNVDANTPLCLCARCGPCSDAGGTCDDGQRCIDFERDDISTLTDRDICTDGVSNDEVIDRCAGLPNG